MSRSGESKLRYVTGQLVHRYFSHGVGKTGAELAYFLLFSLFPLLIFLNSLMAQLNFSAESALGLFYGFLPREVLSLVSSYLEHLSRSSGATLTFFGLISAVACCMRTVRALIHALGRAGGTQYIRGAAQKLLLSLVLTVMILLCMLLTLVLLIGGDLLTRVLSELFPVVLLYSQLILLLRYSSVGIGLFIMLISLYMLAPAGRLSFRRALPGALSAMGAWLLLSWGFAQYVERMGSYPVLYGSLGTLIVLMLWLYLTGIALVMGGELNQILLDWGRKPGAIRGSGSAGEKAELPRQSE